MNIYSFIFPLLIIIAIPLYIIAYIFLSNYAGMIMASPSQTFIQHQNVTNMKSSFSAVDHFPISMTPRLHLLNCSNAFTKDDEHIQDILRDGRITMVSDPALEDGLNMDCNSIKARWTFPMEPTSQMETEFPIAYARTIYRDFLLVEQMLATEYAPQNFYCYSIDAKATPLFKKRIHSMASCFPNVIVAHQEYNVQSNGKNVSRSHLECLKELAGIDRRKKKKGMNINPWKYAILLQNQDIPLRTNAEMVEMLTVYNGTNEVGTLKITKGSIREDLNWTLQSLKLYKNGSNPWPNGERMHHTKSLNLVALSRQAVDFMLTQLRLDIFIDRLEATWYGMDEVFISSLNSNLPDFPGGYSWKCLEEKGCEQEPVSRFVIWNSWKSDRCLSGYFRHGVCVMGLEDIWQLARLPYYFYANKMLPEFDYGAIHCWLQNLARRRKNEQTKQLALKKNTMRKDQQRKEGMTNKGRLNLNVIANLPHVRYNRLRANGRLDKFHC